LSFPSRTSPTGPGFAAITSIDDPFDLTGVSGLEAHGLRDIAAGDSAGVIKKADKDFFRLIAGNLTGLDKIDEFAECAIAD
jgi:hypothetical protein